MLATVDALVLTEVYAAGEAPIAGADGKSLARAVRVRGKVEPDLHRGARRAAGRARQILRADDVVLTQVYQLFIRATPEQIWEAILTDAEFTAQYFYGARIEVTGERYLSLGPDDSVWGEDQVLEFDPPRRLVHGWRLLYSPELAAEEPRDLGDRAAGRRLLHAARCARPAGAIRN